MSRIAIRTTLALLTLTLLPAAEPAAPEETLPPGAVLRYGSSRFRHGERLTDVTYSPDGRTIASGALSPGEGKQGSRGNLVFWDAVTGAKRFESAPEDGLIWQVTFAPDGRTVAAVHQGARSVALYDAKNGKLLRRVGDKTHGQPAYSRDGKTVASAVGNEVHLWDVDTGDETQRLEGHTGSVRWVALSPDGRMLVSGAQDRTMRVWDLVTGEVLFQEDELDSRYSYVDFSPDSREVGMVVAGHLILWDVADGRESRRIEMDEDGQGFGWSPDGKTLVLVARNTADVVENATGKQLRRFQIGVHGRLPAWTLSPDCRTLTIGGWGCVVHQWDLATGEHRDHGPGHRFPIESVTLAPDGRTAVTRDNSGGIRLWDAATGREARKFQTPKDAVSPLLFGPDGKPAAFCCSSEDGVLRFVDAETGKERSRIRDLGGDMRLLAASTDGAVIAVFTATGEGATEAVLWESATGKRLRKLEKVPATLTALAFTSDGKRLAGASEETIQLWDAATGREVRRINVAREMTVRAVQFSADGRRLLAVGQDTAVGVWETDTGRQVMFTRVEGEGLFTANLSADGRTVAVCPLDEQGMPAEVRLLETATGQERCRVAGHLKLDMSLAFNPNGVAFTPDGRSLITVGADTTALVWSLPFRAGDRTAPAGAEVAALWESLAEAETTKSYSAVAALAAAPDLLVPFVRERLRPIPPLDEKARKEINRHLADLDSDDFDTREKAAVALERLEELAGPAMRRVMAGEPSAEVRRHLTRLLDKLSTNSPAPDTLRTIRVVEALELSGSPEAVKLLEELAKGAAEAYRTREAADAVARLKATGQKMK